MSTEKKWKIEPKKTLNIILSKLSVDMKLAQMKLEDGVTVFEAESFEPEFSVGIVQEDGIVPVPVGEYTLEDGRVLVVEQEGVIASIGEAAVMDEGADGTPAQQPTKVVETVAKETFFALQEKSIELAKEHETALSKIETLEKEKAELEAKVAKLEEVKPIKHNPEPKGKTPAGNETLVDFVNRVVTKN